MTAIGSLCTGAGGLDLAAAATLGGHLAFTADNDPGAAAIIAHRMPGIPNLGDIAAADWDRAPRADVLTAGFPCQDVSCAGPRAGMRAGNRTGTWAHVAVAIAALKPSLVILENVGGLLSAGADSVMEPCPWCLGNTRAKPALRASGAVLGDLATLGFDAEWAVVPASAAGAPHRRERVFIAAWPAAHPRNRAITQRARHPGRAGRERPPERPGPGRGGDGAAADADSAAWRRYQPRSRPGPVQGPAVAEWPPLQPGRCDSGSADGGTVDWQHFAPAITRWEAILGRPAPRPAEPGRHGERLSPAFAEWMMGLPGGWVTGIPGLSRNAQLKALGNAVVPQQAVLALSLLLPAAAGVR